MRAIYAIMAATFLYLQGCDSEPQSSTVHKFAIDGMWGLGIERRGSVRRLGEGEARLIIASLHSELTNIRIKWCTAPSSMNSLVIQFMANDGDYCMKSQNSTVTTGACPHGCFGSEEQCDCRDADDYILALVKEGDDTMIAFSNGVGHIEELIEKYNFLNVHSIPGAAKFSLVSKAQATRLQHKSKPMLGASEPAPPCNCYPGGTYGSTTLPSGVSWECSTSTHNKNVPFECCSNPKDCYACSTCITSPPPTPLPPTPPPTTPPPTLPTTCYCYNGGSIVGGPQSGSQLTGTEGPKGDWTCSWEDPYVPQCCNGPLCFQCSSCILTPPTTPTPSPTPISSTWCDCYPGGSIGVPGLSAQLDPDGSWSQVSNSTTFQCQNNDVGNGVLQEFCCTGIQNIGCLQCPANAICNDVPPPPAPTPPSCNCMYQGAAITGSNDVIFQFDQLGSSNYMCMSEAEVLDSERRDAKETREKRSSGEDIEIIYKSGRDACCVWEQSNEIREAFCGCGTCGIYSESGTGHLGQFLRFDHTKQEDGRRFYHNHSKIFKAALGGRV